MSEHKHIKLEFEQIQSGVHAQNITTTLSKKRTRAILRVLNAAGLEEYLKHFPLGQIGFVVFEDPTLMAFYSPSTKTLLVNSQRANNTFGTTFAAGRTETVSAGAATKDEALARSLLHEMGHHLFYSSIFSTNLESEIRQAFETAKPISIRASRNWQEWLSECFTAFHFENLALQKHDPVGYAMIEQVRKELKLP
jgi:hypothetical protein